MDAIWNIKTLEKNSFHTIKCLNVARRQHHTISIVHQTALRTTFGVARLRKVPLLGFNHPHHFCLALSSPSEESLMDQNHYINNKKTQINMNKAFINLPSIMSKWYKVHSTTKWTFPIKRTSFCYILKPLLMITHTEQGLHSASQQGEELLQERRYKHFKSDLALIWFNRESFCKLRIWVNFNTSDF